MKSWLDHDEVTVASGFRVEAFAKVHLLLQAFHAATNRVLDVAQGRPFNKPRIDSIHLGHILDQ
jgi:hypothetical protein